MAFVEIYKLQNDGSQKTVVVCRLVGEEAKCEGNEAFVQNLEKGGIFDYKSPAKERLFPKDGLRFLEQLQNNFKSGYLNASEVKPN